MADEAVAQQGLGGEPRPSTAPPPLPAQAGGSHCSLAALCLACLQRGTLPEVRPLQVWVA